MRQTTELSRVKARIKALAEKTVSNGCTEAEAMAAADMVGKLLERYALSMEEIDVREERCVRVEVPIGGKQRRRLGNVADCISKSDLSSETLMTVIEAAIVDAERLQSQRPE